MKPSSDPRAFASSDSALVDESAAHERLEPGSPPASMLLTLLPELKLMVGLVSATVLIAALYYGRDILIPLCLALLLGFILDPVVGWLKRRGLPRGAAVVVVMTMVLAAVGLTGIFLGQQVSSLSAELPSFHSNIRAKLNAASALVRAPGMFDGILKTFDAVKKEVETEAPVSGTAVKKTGPGAAPLRVQVEEAEPSALSKGIGWFEAASGPLANAGIAFVFVVFVLLDRLDLRDRLLRLWGGSLHQSTDAMDEAGRRISRYLTMQLFINLSYGVPMGIGLWLIGIPGALLWGALAALMRFVPYIGPMISAIFPLALAFAVDPGWSLLLWTVGLIVALELLSNNVVEPWLYGVSTGLSAMSLMVAATFWTALWGPIGLIMSTPLTVCLLVIGRHLPRLGFLNVLLGTQPALDAPSRVYQRLLAGDVDEAIELAVDRIEDGNVVALYDEIGLPVLRMATTHHTHVATVEHRHRIVVGMNALLDEMQEQHPSGLTGSAQQVVCLGGKWEVDNLAARMLTHALATSGQQAAYRPAGTVSADYVAGLDLDQAHTVFISYFSPDPEMQARHICRRLRRRWPHVQIVLALWNAAQMRGHEEASDGLGADAIVTSMSEAVLRAAQLSGVVLDERVAAAPVPADDAARVAALRQSGALDARAKPLFDTAAKRAADIFDVPMALVSLIDEHTQDVRGSFGELVPSPEASHQTRVKASDLNVPRDVSICGHVVFNAQTLVVPDLARDLRFAGNKMLRDHGIRFYAGAPLLDADRRVLGTLCLFDAKPRTLSKREVQLLETMAAELMKELTANAADWSDTLVTPAPAESEPSSVVGQILPT